MFSLGECCKGSIGELFYESLNIRWTYFVSVFNQDVARWWEYSQHVHDIESEIQKQVSKKRVLCCKFCETIHLDNSKAGIDHLCTQLIQSLISTEYWRKWLDQMVTQCQSIMSLLTGTDLIQPLLPK